MKKLFICLLAICITVSFAIADDDDREDCEKKCKKIYKKCRDKNPRAVCGPIVQKCKKACEDRDDDARECPDPDPCPECPPIEGCDIEMLLEKPAGAALTSYRVYQEGNNFYLVPTWADPEPDPEPDPTGDFDPESCARCHKNDDSDFRWPNGWNVEKVHDKHKFLFNNDQCERCHK